MTCVKNQKSSEAVAVDLKAEVCDLKAEILKLQEENGRLSSQVDRQAAENNSLQVRLEESRMCIQQQMRKDEPNNTAMRRTVNHEGEQRLMPRALRAAGTGGPHGFGVAAATRWRGESQFLGHDDFDDGGRENYEANAAAVAVPLHHNQHNDRTNGRLTQPAMLPNGRHQPPEFPRHGSNPSMDDILMQYLQQKIGRDAAL